MEKVRHSLLSRVLFGLWALVLCVALALASLSLLVHPSRIWWLTLVGWGFLPLLVLGVITLLWGLFRLSRMTGLLALALLPFVFFFGRYCRFKAPEPQPSQLTVLSYNVGLFSHADGIQDRLVAAEEICRQLKEADADILCLQEFYLPNNVDIDRFLRQRFPGYQAEYYVLTGAQGMAGNVTLSRKPVYAKGKLDFENSTNMALYTDIGLDSAVVRVYNCHFESYNISIPGVFRSAAHGDEEAMESTGKKMRRSIIQRAAQVDLVRQDADDAPVRSLIAGDFNDTPLSYTYRRLSKGRKDAFAVAGKGLGATYRGTGAMLRIDYLMAPPDLETVSYETLKQRLSDHYPILARYIIHKR